MTLIPTAQAHAETSANIPVNYSMMGWSGGWMWGGWVTMVLIWVILIFTAAALWKYINKK